MKTRTLIWTYPLTLLAVGMLFISVVTIQATMSGSGPERGWVSFLLGMTILSIFVAGSFVFHVPMVLVLRRRLCTERHALILLLAVLSAVISLLCLYSWLPRPVSLLIGVPLAGLVMAAINLLVCLIPARFTQTVVPSGRS